MPGFSASGSVGSKLPRNIIRKLRGRPRDSTRFKRGAGTRLRGAGVRLGGSGVNLKGGGVKMHGAGLKKKRWIV